jgi:hypothetical protein
LDGTSHSRKNERKLENTDNEEKKHRRNETEFAKETEVDDKDLAEEDDEEHQLASDLKTMHQSKYRSVVEKILSYQQMSDIGKKIKRVIDYGRLLYLQQYMNLHVVIKQYCDKQYTPEAFMIIATEKRSK